MMNTYEECDAECDSVGFTNGIGFTPLSTDLLPHVTNSQIDLFIQYDKNGPVRLYQRAGVPIATDQVALLRDTGVRQLLVRTSEFQSLSESILESVEHFAGDNTIPATNRFAAIQCAMSLEVERAVQSHSCASELVVAKKVGGMLVSLFRDSKVLPVDLFRLARHDSCTFTHVSNVASYMLILAQHMGITDLESLEQIATGALLHDIGKRFIPAAILTKPSRLEPQERAIVETHPTRGYELLWRRAELTPAQLMMVYQHHERIDGKGYPVGIVADEIEYWARMLAVVDVFDAMTGVRPYRRPASRRNALDWIDSNAGTQFDREVAQCWIASMSVT